MKLKKDHYLSFLLYILWFLTVSFHYPFTGSPVAFTGLLSNFDSFIPISYKRGFDKCTLFRYFNISSSYAISDAEVEKFKKIMILNGYSKKLFDKIVRNRVVGKPLGTSKPNEP